MARRSRSREEWRLLIAEFERSGLTADAFARKYDVGASTLTWWRSRLRRERVRGGTSSDRALVPFVRVTVAEPTAPSADVGGDGLRLDLPGGLVLRFGGRADAEYVAAVIASTSQRLGHGGGRC